MLKYKNYQLIRPDKNNYIQIIEFVNQNNGSIFHEIDLNKIIESTFGTELFYLVDNSENIKHAAVVHITKNKFGLKRYNLRPLFDMPYAGFIGEVEVEFNQFSVGFMESISYMGFPYIQELNIDSDNIKIGETSMVDLSLDENKIFNEVIHSKRRNMIRKALKQNIEVKIFNSAEGLKGYWPILKQLHDKLGYNQLTYDFYDKILKEFGPKGQAFILIAYKNGVEISGVFILGNKNYMHYYKGASAFGVKNEGQGELLQWEAIKLSKTLGAKQYDLCNLNKDSLPKIYKFKTGISKNIYQYPIFSQNALGYKIVNKLTQIV